MIKKLLLVGVILSAIVACGGSRPYGAPTNESWEMIFAEEFDAPTLNTQIWDTITRGGAHWNRYMVASPQLINIENGNLVLTGRTRTVTTEDSTLYETGGVWSPQKFSFTNGRIDIRAKLDEAKGAWPALWLLPNERVEGWPHDGEIDIMEHLNHDEFVYQTVHTNYTYNLQKTDNPVNFATPRINRGDYNVYSVERTDSLIKWFINGTQTHSYAILDTPEAQTEGQWPFTTPFYVVISQQLGGPGTWVGEVDTTQLPLNMYVDYVRVYERR